MCFFLYTYSHYFLFFLDAIFTIKLLTAFLLKARFFVTVYAYLRVSTDRQDVDNQRYGILEYANAHGLAPLHFVEDMVSGRLSKKRSGCPAACGGGE